jgi:hypothetical protein
MKYTALVRLKTEGEPYFEALLDELHHEIGLGYAIMRECIRPLAASHVWIPRPLELVAVAAALVLIENPIVTRRFWAGWGRL